MFSIIKEIRGIYISMTQKMTNERHVQVNIHKGCLLFLPYIGHLQQIKDYKNY